MRILFLTQYYPPEVGAAQNRLSRLATFLKQSGHTVTVLTALPNYPIGAIYEGYKDRLVVGEIKDGITVIRTWLYTRRNLKFVGRLINYLSFSGMALLVSMYKVGRQDIVIAESPPLFVGAVGFIISNMKKAKFVFNVSDLWTDSAIDLGMLKNSILIGMAQRVENFLYRKADLITGQTQGIVDKIQSRVNNRPIALITNGVDQAHFGQAADQYANRRRNGSPVKRFSIGYAGLHGLMHDLESVIEAADLLRAYEDVFFVFYGDGPRKEKLIQLAKEARIRNIVFYPPQPVGRMPEIFGSFDAMVIPLKRLGVLKGAIPFKMLEAMAAALPIVLAGEGEAEKLVRDAECGIVVEPENPKSLAEGLLELYHNESCRRRFGENARDYVLQHYDQRQISTKFAHLLSKVVYGEEHVALENT